MLLFFFFLLALLSALDPLELWLDAADTVEEVDDAAEGEAVMDAAEGLGEGEGDETGNGLRRRTFIPSSSLSLLDEEELLLLLLLLDDDEEELLDDDESSTFRFAASPPASAAFFARLARLFFITNSNLSAASISRASRPRNGNFASSAARHRTAMCFRATRVFLHTSWKLTRLLKFCVTAMVSSKLSTAWCQPPGTKIVSPGYCITSRIPRVGPPGLRSSSSLMRGRILVK